MIAQTNTATSDKREETKEIDEAIAQTLGSGQPY